MYLTMKQQVKHLSKEEYHSIKELCHIAKNLANQAIYNVRQYYFTEGEYLNYEKNYSLLKTSDNYKMLNSNILSSNVLYSSINVLGFFILKHSFNTSFILQYP